MRLSPAHAADWISEDGFVVHQTGPASFEVPWRGRSAVRDFWCAAGSYVRYELNLPGTTRVYRTSAVPRRSGQAMQFSLSPANAQPTGLLHAMVIRPGPPSSAGITTKAAISSTTCPPTQATSDRVQLVIFAMAPVCPVVRGLAAT